MSLRIINKVKMFLKIVIGIVEMAKITDTYIFSKRKSVSLCKLATFVEWGLVFCSFTCAHLTQQK
jgi:hypothetical protein